MQRRILLVEDEPLLRELTRDDLVDEGHAVIVAGDAHEALEALEAASFDILLTDIRMPGRIDGWELARLARWRMPELAVIYISGYSPETIQPVEGGRFLKKPFRCEDLLRAITEVAGE